MAYPKRKARVMGLSDALKAQKVPVGGPRCQVGRLLHTLPADDVDALAEALDSDMTHASISRALIEEGHRVTAITVGRHRREECSCGTF